MPKSAEQVQDLKAEIQAWLDATDDLLFDTHWRELDDHFGGSTNRLHAGGNRIHTALGLPGGEPVGDSYEVLLVLCPGSGMSPAFSYKPTSNDGRCYADELDEILKHQDCWYVMDDDGLLICSLD